MRQSYFHRLVKIVDGDAYSKLLEHLHRTEFTYEIPMDENRAKDGIEFRHSLGIHNDHSCSVLEMMIALAARCEVNIMSDSEIGDRTRVWFWEMVQSLGLAGMTDDAYDEYRVQNILDTFLRREYQPDGQGGLFTIPDCPRDLRTVEIWYQMCWYLNSNLRKGLFV